MPERMMHVIAWLHIGAALEIADHISVIHDCWEIVRELIARFVEG